MRTQWLTDVTFGQLREALTSEGLALLHAVPLERFRALIAGLGTPYQHPDADAEGVTRVAPDDRIHVQAGYGFTSKELGLHTDRSSVEVPPRYLGFYFECQAQMGGLPRFADLREAFEGIDENELAEVQITDRDGNRRPLQIKGLERAYRYRDDPWWHPAGPESTVAQVRKAVAEATVELPGMVTGDAYILENHRVAHGRASFCGEDRLALRILVHGVSDL